MTHCNATILMQFNWDAVEISKMTMFSEVFLFACGYTKFPSMITVGRPGMSPAQSQLTNLSHVQ